MDKFDKHILQLLQSDCTLSVSSIAERVGLSSTPCWRRIQRLEEKGIITDRVVLTDPTKLNVGLTVFVMIKTSFHEQEWLDQFSTFADDIDEIVEFYRLSGEHDYLLRVVIPDMQAYDRFYKKMIQKVKLSDVSSSFSMEKIKYTTALPVDYV
ncbi:Lrp/AsnC family transcriptional regulator [Thalassotalea sp. ND16A]|uniref:Lrp/AsnC family transcriptional regulator n=1 Tax=Thalassotalea sp. ND16A TaxID=1535422 RepID=UPI00051A6D84|nr:Lrp/AsnC family transcriptional regulator [Thalassotalea sp. ND16A]KGJ87865.1 putative transcriptional regulator, AsnC family [Thalassotalea sp. ND16A]